MKIALIIDGKLRFGGAERRLVRILGEIGKRHEVILISRGCSIDFLDESLALANCCVSHLSKVVAVGGCSRVIEGIKVLQILKKLDVDVVHVFDFGKINALLVLWMHFLKKKVLLTIANGLVFYASEGERNERLVDFVLSRVDALDVLYPDQLKFYSEKTSENCLAGCTPGTFTDLEAYCPVDKEKLFVFIAAQLDKQKNPQLMVDAVKLCQDSLRANGYRVLICGCRKEERYIRAQIRDYHLNDIVTMPGYVDTSMVLPRAEVLCALQIVNNYPSQTIAEAAASGCFVIATRVGETYRMLDPSFSGMVGLSPSELAKAMEAFMLLPDDRKKRYCASARAYAEEHFSIGPSVEYFSGLYESCLSAAGDKRAEGRGYEF